MARSQAPFPIFIQPTEPTPTLLAHFDGTQGATSYTCPTGQVVTLGGGTVLGTASKKFGSASIDFGSGVNNRWAEIPASPNWAFTGDFTIDYWVNMSGYNPASSIPLCSFNMDSFQLLVENVVGDM